MMGLPDIDPQRARGAFVYGLTQLDVRDGGLASGTLVEIIDVMATLAVVVKHLTAAEHTPEEMLLHRLAMATVDVLSTAFSRTPQDREIVQTWRDAYAEWLSNGIASL